MNRNISRNVYGKLFVLLLSLILTSCSSSKVPEQNRDGYARNDLSEKTSLSKNGVTLQTSAEALKFAQEAEQRGDLDKALYYYIQALQFAPKNAAVLIKIAYIHELRGNKVIAVRAYTEALASDPNLLLAHQGLGVIKMELKKYQEAQEHLQQAILLDQKRLKERGASEKNNYYELDNGSPIKSYDALAIIEDMNRNFDVARIYYNLVLNYDQNSAMVLSNIGYSYYLTGELTAAERYFRQAINADPKFKRAWTNLGLIFVRKGQYNKAVKTFKQVMNEFDAYNDLGYLVMLDGHLDDAEFFFKKAIDMSPMYFEKAYSNLEQVQMKKRELWLLQQEAHGDDIGASEKRD